MSDLSGFVDAVGRVIGGARASMGPGVPEQAWMARGAGQAQLTGRGQAAVAAMDAHGQLSARTAQLVAADERINAAASAAAMGHRTNTFRLDRTYANAGADVSTYGPQTNTQPGQRALVSALTNRLEETKSTLEDSDRDAKARSAEIRSATDRYKDILGGSGTRPASVTGGGTASPALAALASPAAGAMAPAMAPMMGAAAPLMGAASGILGAPAQIVPAVLSGLTSLAKPATSGGGLGSGTGLAGSATSGGAMAQVDGNLDDTRKAIVERALSNLGKPYVFGANGPNAYDCSSLVQDAYHAAGINVPRTTYDWAHLGRTVPLSELRAGDAILARWENGRPEHMMMAISPTRVIEAPNSGEVVKVRDVPHGNIVVKRILPG